MTSSEGKRFVYETPQLLEVICQLRYPTILSIDAKTPADFQDTVRAVFPRYQLKLERVAGPEGKTTEIRNHNFISADGAYKISMTKDFIALSTMRYTGWEDFAHALDEPLGQFIRLYRPAYFERVGLRFVNAFSRQKLGLEDRRWNDLFQPQYLSVLDDDEIDEESVQKCSVDLQLRLDARASLKLHAGPGRVNRTMQTPNGPQTVQDSDVHFIFDQDLFTTAQTQLPEVMADLSALHEHADRVFSDAITDLLHEALGPVEV